MMRGLWTAATGMSAQQSNVSVIANNLANVNTAGFKKSRINFQDLMYQNLRNAGVSTAEGSQLPVGIQVGMGTKVISVSKNFQQGDYNHTNNPLDLAVDGRGYFKLISNNREVYTRAGSFKTDKDGNIMDSNGSRLQPEFAIPSQATTITVDSGGKLVATDSSGKELGSVQLVLYDFLNSAGLKAIGQNYFVPTDASGDPVEGNPGTDQFGTISQGFLEMSNVDIVEEMVSMIMAQRAYEINSKAIQTGDEMLQQVNNLKR
jgi:flagellar basal-body rod protein FlgG